jgi:3-oxoacyl-[acyl-carrier protein] reductase
LRPRFERRVCLVTGGGRGIGRAVALALAHEGAFVGIVARTEAQCENVAAEIGESRGVAVPADVRDSAECERAVAVVAERFGPIDVLINAAGISPVLQRAEEHDVQAFQDTLAVNLGGAFCMTRAAAPTLFANGGGAVVMVASVLGAQASPRLAGYGASKAGVVQLTRTLAREWGDRGVRVNAVCPGYVRTELTERALDLDHIREAILVQTPLARLATLDEVVAPTLFLASSDASYVTGAALLVDGGMAA